MRLGGAELVGGDHEALVLDRARPEQHLPVVAAGDRREGRGHGKYVGSEVEQRPEQLGESQVVTDGHSELGGTQGRGDHLIAGCLGVRLAVLDPADIDVEHVDLAIARHVAAVRRDEDRGVGRQPSVGRLLGEASGQQVDAVPAGPAAGGGHRLPVCVLGSFSDGITGDQQGPLLGQHHELGSVLDGGEHLTARGLDVEVAVRARIDLYDGSTHQKLIDKSISFRL